MNSPAALDSRWKLLIPFFAVSLNFGVQAILGNRGPETAYTLHFTFEALKTCLAYYGNLILVIPYGGFMVAALFFIRDKWARFGVIAILLFMGPMLFLPGRLFGAYLYVPLVGLAIAGAALQFQGRPYRVAYCRVLIWLPLNYREMQIRRKKGAIGDCGSKSRLRQPGADVRQDGSFDRLLHLR